MRGGLTIDIFIPKGVLSEPGLSNAPLWFLGSNPIVLLPPWAFLAYVRVVVVQGTRSEPRPFGGAHVRAPRQDVAR